MWLAGELRLWPQQRGIDLAGDDCAVEMKTCWKKYNPKFTIHNYQVNDFLRDNPGKELFWAFLYYDVRATRNGWAPRDRETWIVPWEFAASLPVRITPHESYRYVRGLRFPYAFTAFQRRGGVIHVPQSSLLEERLAGAKIYMFRSATSS